MCYEPLFAKSTKNRKQFFQNFNLKVLKWTFKVKAHLDFDPVTQFLMSVCLENVDKKVSFSL